MIALRELLRRPGRFVPVVAALSLLVLLLVVLGGFLDGLTLDQTGALRAQGDVAFATTAEAELLPNVSQVPPELREDIADVDSVGQVGGISRITTTASIGDSDDVVDVVVYGYEVGTGRLPAPPPGGEAIVDRRLTALTEISDGDTLRLGPQELEVAVAEFVDDATEGAPTVWIPLAQWRTLVSQAAPASPLAQQGDELLVLVPAEGETVAAAVGDVSRAVPAAAVGTADDVIATLPAVSQQAATFQGIIGVTFVVSLLVVGLFFVLLTLERLRLYAVLKAIGGRTADLLAGLAAQAVGIAVISLLIGGLLALALTSVLPADLPIRVLPSRLAILAAGTVVTALAGALVTLRRLLRIDPATAIG